VEVVVVVVTFCLVGDSLHDLAEDGKINDNWRSQEGVLTSVVHSDCVGSSHEDFGSVFIQSSLGVTHVRNIFDHHTVVGMFVWLVQDLIGGNHIIYYIRFADFLASELLGSREVLSVIVTQVVVAHNGSWFQTSGDQEIDQNRLDLGLSRFEVVSTNEDVVSDGHLHQTRNEGVLRGSIDVSTAFHDRCNSVQSGRRDLFFTSLDSIQEVSFSVIHTTDDISESLGVGRLQHDDLIHLIGRLEVADILSNFLHHLNFGSSEDIVCSVLLIGGNEVWNID